MPLTDAFPSVGGKVFGNGLKWRFRYVDTNRNVYTGMSPIPAEGLNLGVEVPDGSADWMGVRAYFQLPGTAAVGVNRVELLRNTTEQDDIWYVVADIAKAAAGHELRFHLRVELGGDKPAPKEVVDAVNEALAKVLPALKLE